MKSKTILSAAISLVLLFTSCVSTGGKRRAKRGDESITLVFAGDIMAHSQNFEPGDFSNIWRDIKPLLQSGDLTFGNIEAPVADSLKWSSYPTFNMHREYVEAAIEAGFNVFSLANNHTNDQKLDGITETKKYFDSREGIWASGLKGKENGPISHKLIEKTARDGSEWKILFVAITELLNSPNNSSWINYYPSNESARNALKKELKNLSEKNPHDLFILSVHTDEPEYVLDVTESHKIFFKELIEECKVDIVWANHPHVTKTWEKIQTKTIYDNDSFIMYANGNTISGQRTDPKFDAPETARDYTGDGLILRINVKRDENEAPREIDEEMNYEEPVEPEIIERKLIKSVESFIITTFISPNNQYVVKFLDDDLIKALDRCDYFNWSGYLSERKKIMEQLLQK